MEGQIRWPMHWHKPDAIMWRGDSSHSRAGEVRFGEDRLFVKVYGVVGEDKFFSVYEAESLVASIIDYRQKLHSIGIPVAQIQDYAFVPVGDGCEMFILESFEGKSLATQLITVEPESAWSVLKKVADTLELLFASARQGELQLGIDPKLSNFVQNGHGVTYVDLVWPLNSPELNGIHEDIVPLWKFRYYSVSGTVLNWLIQVGRHDARILPYLTAWAAGILNRSPAKEGDEVIRQVAAQAAKNLSGSNVLGILNSPSSLWNVDLLRALAVRMCEKDECFDTRFLETVLALTRTNPHDPLPKERINECRAYMVRAARDLRM